VTLWAWERPEDLTAIRGGSYGVAFLAKTIYLAPGTGSKGQEKSGETVRVRPRMQPLAANPATPLMAVVRIETPAGLRAASYANETGQTLQYPGERVNRVVSEIEQASRLPGVSAVQIDFDAAASQHEFYRQLLVETRRRLKKETRLSITALASWCVGDRWLEELPDGTLDEAVPMLFRMGPGGTAVVRQLQRGEEFPVAVCRNSVGVSMDEPLSRDILAGKFGNGNLQAGKRVYVFSPRSWTAESVPDVARGLTSSSTE